MTSLNNAVKEFREYQILKEELEAKLDELKTAIVAGMGGAEELTVDTYRVRWQLVQCRRLDTVELQKAMPDIAELYTRETEYHRFSVA